MAGRFDLARPCGTCYLASSPQTALRERCGAKLLDHGVLTTDEAARIAVSVLAVPKPHGLADMRSSRAAAFGATREINTIVPYDLPQRWAATLADSGAEGIRYDARFSTSPTAVAYAIFGDAGEAAWPTDSSPADGSSIAVGAGIAIAPIPRPSAISIVPTPSRRPSA
jgi:hypothetical protein